MIEWETEDGYTIEFDKEDYEDFVKEELFNLSAEAKDDLFNELLGENYLKEWKEEDPELSDEEAYEQIREFLMDEYFSELEDLFEDEIREYLEDECPDEIMDQIEYQRIGPERYYGYEERG